MGPCECDPSIASQLSDDETLFAFHTLVRNHAHVVVVLRSQVEALRGGPDFQTRELETHCAMLVAGCSWEQWPYSDIDPDWAAIERRIRTVVSEYDVVIAPAFEDGGHEHHNALALAVSRAKPPGHVVRYLSYKRGYGRSTNGAEVVPTLFEREQKRIALLCYQSQIDYEPTRPWFGDDQREFVR